MEHPGVTLGHHEWPKSRGPADAVYPDACDANGGWEGYLEQTVQSKYGGLASRAQWYCDNISRHYDVDSFTPARPRTVKKPENIIATEMREQFPYTMFFPFTDFPARDWPVDNWRELIRQFDYPMLACNGSQLKRLKSAFGDLKVSTAIDLPPAAMLSLIAHAKMVIGNDSGMVHVAGLLGTPARVIMSILRPDFVFGPLAPSVVGVTAEGDPRNGCAGLVENGCAERCGQGCPTLAGISAERVIRSLA